MATSESTVRLILVPESRPDENNAPHRSTVTGSESELYLLQQRLSEVEGALQAVDECWLSRKRRIIEEADGIHDRIDEIQHKLHQALAFPENPSALQEAFKFVDGNVFTTISTTIILANCVSMILEAKLHDDQLLLPLLADPTHSVHPLVMKSIRLFRLLRVLRVMKVVRIVLESDVSWVEGHKFESFMLTIIMANAVVMGLELDLPWCGWTWVDNLFLVAYVFELVLRFRLLGWSYFSMRRSSIAMSYLDVVIVGAGILEQWLTPAISLLETHLLGRSESSFHLGPEVRILRILRIFRILRIYRVVRSIKPLYVLVGGVVEAMRGMQWVFFLALLMLYACSIFFTSMIGHGYAFDGHPPAAAEHTFGTVIDSMVALFKLMNTDQSVVAPIITTGGGKLMFVGFMVLSNWAILAILTSVVSDRIIAASQKTDAEDEQITAQEIRTKSANRLRVLFAEVDKEGSGRCTQEQFKTMLSDDSLQVELCNASVSDIDRLVETFNIMAKGPVDKKYIRYDNFITHVLDGEASRNARCLLHTRMHLGLIEKQLQTGLGRALDLLGLGHDEIRALVGTAQLLDAKEIKESLAAKED